MSNGYVVYPSSTGYMRLTAALKRAREESLKAPDYKARVEVCDTEQVIARFERGEKVNGN